jgi:hypothetical protein
MCPPVVVVALAAAAAAAGSQVVSAISAKQQGNYEQAAYQQRAAQEGNAAQVDQQQAERQQLLQGRHIAAVQGQQMLAASANGVSANFGTAAQDVSDTATLGNEDMNQLYQQAYQTRVGHDIAISNDLASGNAAKSRGDAAFASGMLGAVSSALGGAKQYAQINSPDGGLGNATGGNKTTSMSDSKSTWGV